MQADEMLRFALYARVSTESQEAQGESLDTQIKQMRKWVRALGGIVVQEYKAQESAMPGGERASLRTLFADAKQGNFNAVMVVALDRLSRDPGQSGAIENSFRLFNLRLFEKTSESSLYTPEGNMMRRMQAVIGAFTVDRLKWSAAASRLEIAKRGWPHGAQRPFGRIPENPHERRTAVAKWVLHEEEYQLARKMCDLYLRERKTFAEVGRAVGMNPETVRRILTQQAGGVWERNFLDPSTNQKVRVYADIPPLLNREEIEKVQERAKLNQDERRGWEGRARDYPLSKYLRCANPSCGWSNLSGHQTYDRSRNKVTGEERVVAYPYYIHLSRSKCGDACVSSVPAEAIEDEVFGRIGQLLKNEDELVEAVRAAVDKERPHLRGLEESRERLASNLSDDRRKLRNAVELLTEHKGTSAETLLQEKVRTLSRSIAANEAALADATERLASVHSFADVEGRARKLLSRLRGLNGYAPAFWPVEAKRLLLAIFFGGPHSTRFDRAKTHVRSDARGIFVRKVVDQGGRAFWTYVAKGQIGSVGGALTQVVELADQYDQEEVSQGFSLEVLVELAQAVDWSGDPDLFRVDPHADRPMSASRCP